MSRTNSRHNVWEHGIYNPNDTQLDSNSFRAFKEQENKLSQMENALRKEMLKAEEYHKGLKPSHDRKQSIGYSNPTEQDMEKRRASHNRSNSSMLRNSQMQGRNSTSHVVNADAKNLHEQNATLRENVEELRKINNDAFEQLTEAHHRIKELEETVNIGGDRDRLDSLKQALEDKNQRIMALQTQMAKMSSGRNWNQSSHDLWTQEMELTNKRREADISLERHRLADLEKSREIIQVLQRENIELKDELDRIKISQDSIVDEEVRALKQSNEQLKSELDQKVAKLGQKSKVVSQLQEKINQLENQIQTYALSSSRISKNDADRMLQSKDKIIDSLRSQIDQCNNRSEVDGELLKEKDRLNQALKQEMEEVKQSFRQESLQLQRKIEQTFQSLNIEKQRSQSLINSLHSLGPKFDEFRRDHQIQVTKNTVPKEDWEETVGEFLSNVSMRLKEFLDDNKILSVKIKESEKLREALDCDIDQTKDVMDKLTEERTAATREIQRHKEIIKGLQIKIEELEDLNENLHNRAANFDENLELIEKLEELSAVNEDAAKERDQINEILMKLLSSLDNPKLSQVYSELKFLNTSLRKAKSKEIESRFDETDVNIIERKVNLLMDELTLCIERITSQIKQSNQSQLYSPINQKSKESISKRPESSINHRRNDSNFINLNSPSKTYKMSRGAERFDHTPNSYSDYPPHQASMYSGKGIDVKVTISPSRNTQFQKRAEEPSNFNNTSTYSHLRDKLNTMKQALH